MKNLISLVVVFQFIFFNSNLAAANLTCKQTLSGGEGVILTPLIQSTRKAGRKYLDTTAIPGFEGLTLEWVAPGGMVKPINGAFTCTYCGTKHQIDKVPDIPVLQCTNCPHPVVMNQKSQPPMIVVKSNKQIYVSDHNIVRDKKIIEFFETKAVGCANCSSIKLDPDEQCHQCGQSDNVEINRPPVESVDWSEVQRNPKKFYPALLKMGIMNPVFAKSQGYMTSRELFDVAKEMMSDGFVELSDMFRRGFINPKEAVQKNWITITVRRFAMEILLAEGFISASSAIVKGWMEKGYAVEKGHILQSEADLLEVEMTPFELFQVAQTQINEGDITLAEAIKSELVDPKLSLEEGWIKLKDRREAVLELIDQGYILVEDALKKGWMVRDFAVNQGLIEADVAAGIDVPEVKGRTLGIQAQQRSEDFGEESPNIAPNAGVENFVIPAFRQQVDQPFSMANISPAWRKVIKIGVASTTALAITGLALIHEHKPETGPVGFGEVVGMYESLIVYESEEVKQRYTDVRFNVETPPEGVRVIQGDISSQIQVSNAPVEETEAVGQLMSVIVLEVNDVEMKIYKQGSVQANFSSYEIGEQLPIIPEGMFEFSIAE